MNKSEELKDTIFKSTLEIQDKNKLSSILVKLNNKSINTLVDLFKEKPEWILKFSNNIKAKKKAFASKDPKAWNDIIEAEALDLLEIAIEEIDE